MYEIIYQLDAIEYLFVFFQLDMYFIFQTKMQGKTTQSLQMPNRHKEIYTFRNTKRKIYKTNAAIWFNKICRERKITPGYISIKINGNKQKDKNTLKSFIYSFSLNLLTGHHMLHM